MPVLAVYVQYKSLGFTFTVALKMDYRLVCLKKVLKVCLRDCLYAYLRFVLKKGCIIDDRKVLCIGSITLNLDLERHDRQINRLRRTESGTIHS